MAETFDCPNTSLKKGATGSKVTLLQTMLKQLGYYNATIDGSFGPVTELAVKKFQTATKHTADGWFGPKTCPDLNNKYLASIGETSTSSNSSKNSSNSSSTTLQDDSKYLRNVINPKNAQINIGGVYFRVHEVSPENNYSSVGEWLTMDMMGDKTYTYQEHCQPARYTVTTYLSNKQYSYMKATLKVLQTRERKVTSYYIQSGTYVLNILPTHEMRGWWRLDITLIAVRK